ncbi:MAG: hypothetical protein ACTSU5_00970 [Promethearchaeota archaeon]
MVEASNEKHDGTFYGIVNNTTFSELYKRYRKSEKRIMEKNALIRRKLSVMGLLDILDVDERGGCVFG